MPGIRRKFTSMRFNTLKLYAVALLLLFLFAPAITAQVCQPVAPGLVSWWSGDGNALDSRSRQNGTLVNGAGFANGLIGQAFNFDSDSNQGVSVPNDPSQNIQGSFSVEAWINPATFPNLAPHIIENRDLTSTSFWLLAVGNGTSDGLLHLNINNARTPSTVPGSIPLNEWTHVAFTHNGNSGTIRLYINGQVALIDEGVPQTTSSTGPLTIGRRGIDTIRDYDGLIDEISLYHRELSTNEVAAIYNAGTAGKCKPTATTPPSGIVGWWSGDGDADDISGLDNDGGLFNGASIQIGRVGQAFNFDGVDDVVRIGNQPEHNVQTGNFSLEAWVYLRNYAVGSSFIAGKEVCAGPSIYAMYVSNGGVPSMRLNNSSSASFFASGPVSGVGLNQWHHLVGTREGNTLRLYLDGLEVGSSPLSGSFEAQTASFSIGERPDGLAESCRSLTDGLIDEVTLYDRALTAAEVESIFNAGIAGKLKTAETPAGFGADKETAAIFKSETPASPQDVAIQVGDVTVTFEEVTTGGVTQQIPLSGIGLPALPSNPASTLIYDIATTAEFLGDVDLCFNLPSFTDAETFATLFVLHLENGTWVNRTTSRDFATRTVCARTTSLSPFAIAPFVPTSANGTISGRVATLGGRGIANASVTITGGNLTEPRRSLSNSFGFYQIEGLPVGQTYVVEVRSRRYLFTEPVRVINFDDSVFGLDFIADSP